MILSFNQKVLTQTHWDTRRAAELMNLASGDREELETVREEDGLCIEQVVDFDDFYVFRHTCQPGSTYALETMDSYSLLMVVEGEIPFTEQQCIKPEEAAFIPAGFVAKRLLNDSANSLVFLQAFPKVDAQ